MSKLLRPSARQMRSDFEQRAFSGMSGSGTLAGLGIGSRSKMQDERSVGELKKRVTAQEDSISDLQREILDAALAREALLKEHSSVQTFLSEISGDERRQAAIADYVAAAEAAATSLEAEISHGRAAVENLREMCYREESDLKFLFAMIGNYRGRVLSAIPSSAGVLCVPERLPDRKFLQDRKSRQPPPMSPLDEGPERRLAKTMTRKIHQLAKALTPCAWMHRRQVGIATRGFFAALKTSPPPKPAAPASPGAPEVRRPQTTGGARKTKPSTVFTHTASFFAHAKISPYMQTLKMKGAAR